MKTLDIDVVAIASGTADLAALTAAARSAAAGAHREETLNGKTIAEVWDRVFRGEEIFPGDGVQDEAALVDDLLARADAALPPASWPAKTVSGKATGSATSTTRTG